MAREKNKNHVYDKFENAKKGAVAGIHKLLKDVIEYRHKNEADYLGNKKTVFKFKLKSQDQIKTNNLFHPDILEGVNFLIENIINQDLDLIAQNNDRIKKWLDEFIKNLIKELEKRKAFLEELRDKKQKDRFSKLTFVVNIDTIVDLIQYLEKIKEILNNFIDKCSSFKNRQKIEEKQTKTSHKIADFLQDELGTDLFTTIIKKGPKGIVQQFKDWKKNLDQKDPKEKRNYIGGKVLFSLGMGLKSPLLMLLGNKFSEKAEKYQAERERREGFFEKLNSKLELQQTNVAKKETGSNKLKISNTNLFQNKNLIRKEKLNELPYESINPENLNETSKENRPPVESNKVKNKSQNISLAQKNSSFEVLEDLNKKLSSQKFSNDSKDLKITNKNLNEINQNIKELLKIEGEKLKFEIEKDNDEKLKRKVNLKQNNTLPLSKNNLPSPNIKEEKEGGLNNLLDMGLDLLSLVPGGGLLKIFSKFGKIKSLGKLFNFKGLFSKELSPLKFFSKKSAIPLTINPVVKASPGLSSGSPALNSLGSLSKITNIFEKIGPLFSRFLPMVSRLGSFLGPVGAVVGTGIGAYQLTKNVIKDTSIGKGSIGEKIYDWLHPEVGSVAMAGETGGGKVSMEKRAGTISSGKGDHGGKSYGMFQFSSKTGGLASFLRDNPEYAAQLGTPGTAEFDANWKRLSKDQGFQQAQLKTGKKLYLNPVLNPAASVGLDTKSRAVQEMLMSTSIQYGTGGANRLLKAVSKINPNFKNMTTEQQINAIQDYKAKTAHIWFKKSSTDVQESVRRRHNIDERKRLLAVLKSEKEGQIPSPTPKPETNLAADTSKKAPVENIKKESQNKTQSKHAGLEKNIKNEKSKTEQPTQIVNNNITNVNNSSQSNNNVVLATLDQSWVMQRARTY